MHFKATALALLAALPSTFAYYGWHHGKTHEVQVGPGGKLVYEPSHIQAQAGDKVIFRFNPKNHTVTQSTFENPCQAADWGFKTGFVPVPEGAQSSWEFSREFIVPDNGEQPLWFYCGQTGHCGQGMVFAINPQYIDQPKSFPAFQERAIATAGGSAPPAPVNQEGQTWNSHHGGDKGWEHGGGHGKEHVVSVGADGSLAYWPQEIEANPGDTVKFVFKAKNHTVTQSSFENPCHPIHGGFKSGFMPVSPEAAASGWGLPEFKYHVTSKDPVWGYCGQTGHCKAGMVFAINAPKHGPHSFWHFQKKAKYYS